MTVSVTLNGFMKSGEAIDFLKQKFPGYQEHTFRNAINLKHLKAAKKVADGNKKVLLFAKDDLDRYARDYAERVSKRPVLKAKTVKSPDLTTFEVPIYKDRLELLLSVFTEEQLQNKLRGVLDEVFGNIKGKLEEIEAKKRELLNEVKQSITL